MFKCRALRRIFGAQKTEVKGNGRNYIVRSLTIYVANPKYGVDKMEKNELVWACRAYSGGECRILGFGGEYWGKDTTVEM